MKHNCNTNVTIALAWLESTVKWHFTAILQKQTSFDKLYIK